MLPRELTDELVLDPVRILVFVYEDVLPATLIVSEHEGMVLEELHRLEQQISKVQGVRLRQQSLIKGVELGALLLVDVPRASRGRRGQRPVVLPLVDAPTQPLGVVGLRIERPGLEDPLRHTEAVGFVVDHEAPGSAQVSDLPAQDTHAGGMKGGDPESLCVGPEDLLHPLSHLRRRLVREGDGENRIRGNSADTDQIRNAVGENPGLPTSGPRQHEQRPLGGFDGTALFGIETVQNRLGEQRSSFGRAIRPSHSSRGSVADRRPCPSG